MEVDVAFLSRRGTAVMRRSQRASGERVHIGRGTDNEVPLNDIRVGLRAAALVVHDGVLTIDRLDNSPLEVNGDAVDTAPLKPGDEIRLGPYRIEVLAPPAGCDGAIQIELVPVAAGTSERLGADVRIGLGRTGTSKRVYAWSGFLVIAVICLAVPIVVFSGGMLNSWHKGTSRAPLPTLVGLSWNAGSRSPMRTVFSPPTARPATRVRSSQSQIARASRATPMSAPTRRMAPCWRRSAAASPRCAALIATPSIAASRAA